MRPQLRHLLATCAVSAIALGGTTLPSASAADLTCDNPEALQSAVVEAQGAVATAKSAVKASNRPLGRLVSAKRAEARVELKQSQAELRSLAREADKAHSAAELKALRAQVRAERKDVAEARNLLTHKRAVLAAIKADRSTARTSLQAARVVLHDLVELQDTCSTTPVEPAV